MHLIYLLTNGQTGKQYVGQTSRTLEERMKGHREKAADPKCTYPLARSIRKHGWSAFRVQVIEVCASQIDADVAEPHWISFYDTLVPLGYNLELGGVGIKPKHEETRRKISESLRRRVHTERSRSLRRVKAVAESNPNVKLTWSKVREIRSKYKAGIARQPLANEYHVTFQCVDNIVKGKTWREPHHKSPLATPGEGLTACSVPSGSV